MRIIFSRKGFDSAAGGAPSVISRGQPVSLPIPTRARSETRYADLGLGALVERQTRGRISANHLCHHDPMFENGRCAFGQTGPAQSHLANNNVDVGDVFLFFGLFSDCRGNDRHHRIFGYQKIEEIIKLGARPSPDQQPEGFSHRHPHTIGVWNENNTLYLGRGSKARTADPALRLTAAGEPVSIWSIPAWLRDTGLSYHGRADRWATDGRLRVVARGQEFVSDVDGRQDALDWLDRVIEAIEGE